MVMAETTIDFGECKDYTITLIMTEGEYYTAEEKAPSCGVYEENFDGEYVLQVRDNNDKMVDELSLNQAWGYETINFPGDMSLLWMPRSIKSYR